MINLENSEDANTFIKSERHGAITEALMADSQMLTCCTLPQVLIKRRETTTIHTTKRR